MKLTYHKIRGVDKGVCTAEQKIAYNLAFRAHISYQDAFDRAASVSEICTKELVHEIIRLEIESAKCSESAARYNLDAIFAALNAGLEGYLRKWFIATSYEEIGRAFPACYL